MKGKKGCYRKGQKREITRKRVGDREIEFSLIFQEVHKSILMQHGRNEEHSISGLSTVRKKTMSRET